MRMSEGGSRIKVEIELLSAARQQLPDGVLPGNRSMLYTVSDSDGRPIQFGGIVEEVGSGGPHGPRLTADIAVWSELAEHHMTPGTAFEVWYGVTVGRGRVLELL